MYKSNTNARAFLLSRFQLTHVQHAERPLFHVSILLYFCIARQGRPAACSVKLVYLDADVRVVEDKTGDLFVYTRPVVSRP